MWGGRLSTGVGAEGSLLMWGGRLSTCVWLDALHWCGAEGSPQGSAAAAWAAAAAAAAVVRATIPALDSRQAVLCDAISGSLEI